MAVFSLLNEDISESLGISSVGFYVLFAIMGYRQLLKSIWIQQKIHRLGPLAPFVQWYSLFLAALGFVLIITTVDVIVTYNEMSDEAIKKNAELLATSQLQPTMLPAQTRLLTDHVTNEQVQQEALQFVESTTAQLAQPTTTLDGFMGVSPDLQSTPAMESGSQVEQTKQFVDDLFDKLKIPPIYSALSVCALLLPMPIFFIVTWHSWKIVLKGRDIALEYENHEDIIDIRSDLPWMPSQATNTALFVLIMPTVFSTWGMRAAPKVWNLAYGAAKQNRVGENWEHWKDLQVGAYRADLELASAFQFFAVLSFARLCNRYINDSNVMNAYVNNNSLQRKSFNDQEANEAQEDVDDMKTKIALPLFLGVYAFCVVGFIRCFFNMLCFGVKGEYKVLYYQVNEKILGNVDTIMGFATILCVINMVSICKMKEIGKRISNANLKFLGMRILLIVGQMQMQIILAFTEGSSMFRKVDKIKRIVEKHVEKFANVECWITKIQLNDYEAHLLHICLLMTVCLIVVLLNFFLWKTEREEGDLNLRTKQSESFDSQGSYMEVAQPSMWQQFFCCRGSGPTPSQQAYARVSNDSYPALIHDGTSQSRDLASLATGTRPVPWRP